LIQAMMATILSRLAAAAANLKLLYWQPRSISSYG